MTWAAAPISTSAVIDDKLYIGNLSAALSQDVRKKLGITHPAIDSEYEDLLIHLPNACHFIETALSHGGKVLVHCVMGISRSATVVCAYRRPEIHPNYGFVRQLHAFSECRYKPSYTNSEYIAWKRRQKREVTKYLNLLTDCIPVVPDQLYLTSEFPGDADAAESLLLDLETTHLLSISSAQLPKPNLPSIFQHCFVDVPNNAREALLLELPDVCKFIGDAIARGGRVLVQCRVELRACIVVCAYLMVSRNISPRQASATLEAALPLYNPTTVFYHHLELFAACNCCPTVDHPTVHAWLAEQSGGPTFKLPTKTQSITKTATITTNPPSLTIATTLSNRVPSPSIDPFDMASLNEALSRYQTTRVVL
ncbi:hypothetical protein HD554DRAFT_2092169 [Boletus coccyginus]|nr:hypothetical protein HD554DRAFT_2092169 [Boletus coccyginus]